MDVERLPEADFLPAGDRAHDVRVLGHAVDEAYQLISGHARGFVAGTDGSRETLRELFQYQVACGSAEGIVDVAQALRGHHDERQPAMAPLGQDQMLRQAVEEQGTVSETRQGIVVGEVIQPIRFFDVVERKRDVVRQFLQQPNLILIEEVRFLRNHGKATRRYVVNHQRQHDQAVVAALHHLIAKQDRPTLRREIVAVLQFARPQGDGGQAFGRGVVRESQPGRGQQVGLSASPCHR